MYRLRLTFINMSAACTPKGNMYLPFLQVSVYTGSGKHHLYKHHFGMMLVQKQTPSSLVLWKLMGKRAEHTPGIAAIQERNDKGTKPDHRPKLLWELCG